MTCQDDEDGGDRCARAMSSENVSLTAELLNEVRLRGVSEIHFDAHLPNETSASASSHEVRLISLSASENAPLTLFPSFSPCEESARSEKQASLNASRTTPPSSDSYTPVDVVFLQKPFRLGQLLLDAQAETAHPAPLLHEPSWVTRNRPKSQKLHDNAYTFSRTHKGIERSC